MKYKIGDEIHSKKYGVGEVVQVDSREILCADMPYRVLFEEGQKYWIYLSDIIEKPKESEKSVETKKDCSTCGAGQTKGVCWSLRECHDYDRGRPKKSIKPIFKEQTMWKRTLHLYRMAGTAWLAYGHWIVAAFITPWLVKAVNLGFGFLPDTEKVVDGEAVMMHPQLIEGVWGVFWAWALAIAVILAVCGLTWLWSKATAFWFNEK